MKPKTLLVSLLALPLALSAKVNYQNTFETEALVSQFSVQDNNSTLSLVSMPYRDGANSMKWSWSGASAIELDGYTLKFNPYRDGPSFWVYNETPTNDYMRCSFVDASGRVQFYFDFYLNFTGWRAARIGSMFMLGDKQIKQGLTFRIDTPASLPTGSLYIDRLSFLSDVHQSQGPDAQIPINGRWDWISHWCYLWKWDQFEYDIPVPQTLTQSEKENLAQLVEQVSYSASSGANTGLINSAKQNFAKGNFREENGFLLGSPLSTIGDVEPGDIAWSPLGDILLGLAQDAVFNNNEQSKNDFILLWRFTMNQGFAEGSLMGESHHYGYQTTRIFPAVFLMREKLKEAGIFEESFRAIEFWSGLTHTRQPYNTQDEGLVDTWLTLIMPRLYAACMVDGENERFRAMTALVRWLDESLQPQPGLQGGLKKDGTIFHHNGHYPAYGVGGLTSLGSYFYATRNTHFDVSLESRRNVAKALTAMTRYTHHRDWAIGIAGRHPHAGEISNGAISALHSLSLSGNLTTGEEGIDPELDALYTEYTGVASPTLHDPGFWVYNHAAHGVHRYGNSMVSIKGFNNHVWGVETYAADNRYGRYQSYGAVEIFNEGDPVNRRSSRYQENGWDWNRLPGTTTIHLPFETLQSPLTIHMPKSEEYFTGASSLNDSIGLFGMKLNESYGEGLRGFTSDFIARKTVFTLGKRIVCLGSNINNSNQVYSTETTLFQNMLVMPTVEKMELNGNDVVAFFTQETLQEPRATLLSDMVQNYYLVAPNQKLRIEGATQKSYHNKTKKETQGNFVTAWIDHGKAPQEQSYEYMIMLQPTEAEKAHWSSNPGYEVWQQNSDAHIIHDKETNITAYVCYEYAQGLTQGVVASTDREMLLLVKENPHTLDVSVCDPSLYLERDDQESQAIMKTCTLQGKWQLVGENPAVTVSTLRDETEVTVLCQYGIPVEFQLSDGSPDSDPQQEVERCNVHFSEQQLTVNFPTTEQGEKRCVIRNMQGQLLVDQEFSSTQFVLDLSGIPSTVLLMQLFADKQLVATQKLINL